MEIKYKKKPNRLTRNLIEMGKDLRDVGLIDEESYNKITMSLLKKKKKVKKISIFNQSNNIYCL